ncbi:transposase [Brevundimonas sp. KM4]|uniref:transposase n=1 Tax=Brevundimonas sp. KM4 TaxID=1628191 RepID=UPI000697DD3B
MSQHFLLSAKSRTISVRDVARLGEDEAYAMFKTIRFAENDGEPYCPHCGIAAVYEYVRAGSSNARTARSSSL